MTEGVPGSCTACYREEVPTALAIRGEADWHIAVLTQLGIPRHEAVSLFTYICEQNGEDPNSVPEGRVTFVYRMCEDCAHKLIVGGKHAEVGDEAEGVVPCVTQPPLITGGEGDTTLPDGRHRG